MVRRHILNNVATALALIVWMSLPAMAMKPAAAASSHGKSKLSKVQAVQTNNYYLPMDINNVFNYYGNNGDGSFNKFSTSNEGFEFPIGSNSGTCIFEDGLVWTAFKNGKLYCGGSTYNHGLQAGPIKQYGTATTTPVAANPSNSSYIIYRVRPDIRPTTNSDTVALEQQILQTSEVPYIDRYQAFSAAQLQQMYWDAWKNWPASEGAPYTDAKGVAHPNGGPNYNPATCVPGVPGADQTMWMVMNDMDSAAVYGLYGSYPLGLEVQRTIWAYNRSGALGNTIFLSYKLINKSGLPLDSMYVSQWADPDLGYAGDDATGCDTTRSLGYVYNGEATDANYAQLGLAPPSAGFDFFQGPLVKAAATDTAIFNLGYRAGYKNLPMTAFDFFINGNQTFADPNLGDSTGTLQWYNLMRGRVSTTGQLFPSSVTGGSNFCYPGDPVTGVGPTFIGQGAVSAPADVRMCLCSGPFNMAAGDTQEVVVAAIGAQGSSYLSSVSLLKYYDDLAQTAYNYLFNLPSAPPAPNVSVAQLNGQIVLSWDNPTSNAADENFVDKGYAFQGYNVYQLPSPSPQGAKRLATYDLKTSQGIIEDKAFDPTTGFVITEPVQFGTKSGLQHSITISQDAFTGTPLVNDRDYYFAVTAYSYNGSGVEPNNLESPISGHILTVRPQTAMPGTTIPNEGTFSDVIHNGTANATASVNVVDPYQVTGDQYKVSFHNETYSLGSNGVWTDVTAAAAAKREKLQDLTGSSISSTANWSEVKGAIDIHYLTDVVSPNYDFCDGIQLTFPSNVTIDTTYSPISNNNGSAIPFKIDRATNSIFYGDSARDGDGLFAGGEDIIVTVSPAKLPIIVGYDMYDDNFGVENGYGGQLVDIHAQDTLTGPIANKVITQHQWNVTDVTTGKVALKNQTVYDGVDLYDQNNYFKTHDFYGPGGSSGTRNHSLGTAPVVFDGISVAVNGSFAAPTTIGSVDLNGSPMSIGGLGGIDYYSTANSDTMDMTDFTVFGDNGTAATTLPIYGGAGGATDINDLQQGYQLRWTGVEGDTTINGQTVVITKSGGSIATIFGASGYSLSKHPLNPSPGSSNPFTIRIPFQVWNTTKNEQVNLLVWDRNDAGANVPGTGTFNVWETDHRMYVWVVNTKYSPTVIDPTSTVVADSATWNWVFFQSQFAAGEVLTVNYNHPLQIGKDTFTFTVPKAQYSSTLATQDVSQINVFPNPYFGFNPIETSKYTRFVRFTHLPATDVTIRIFNIAGILVRTLVKPASNTTQFMDWDLLNEHQLPVAAGMYIAYIDCGKLGTKTLKLAIIPEQQFLDHY